MSGAMAGRGRPGPRGPQGPMGPDGPQGDPAFTLAIGQVSAVAYGEEPEVTNVGTDQDQVWDFKLVTGATGVLTGDDPPTGSDGTSLGQLFFCVTNQTYYGLVELNENDNKWRPIMTQENSRISLDFDVLAVRRQGGNPFTYDVAAEVHAEFDEVKQTLSLSITGASSTPIGSFTWLAVPSDTQNKLRALAVARGINTIPLPFVERVNGVDTEYNVNFMNVAGYSLVRLSGVTTDTPVSGEGTGDDPGYKLLFRDGRLVQEMNFSAAPGSNEYGNYPVSPLEDDLTVAVMKQFGTATDYPVSYLANATVVISYA